MPQNSVAAIVQTPDDYLWLGTFGGLARFDGVKFTIFNTGNTPALHSNRITALHVGRDGTLWIGAETGEITRLHHSSFSFFATIAPDTSGDKVITTIYEDRSGGVWVGAGKGGVTRFVAGEAARAEFYDERQGLPALPVTSVCEDHAGKLWVCTPGGLALFEEEQGGRAGKFTVYLKGTARDYLLKIRPHPDGGLWLITQNSLGRFHDGRLTSSRSPQNDCGAALSATAGGDLLFGCSADRIFQHSRLGPGQWGEVTERKLTGNLAVAKLISVSSLYADRENNIWVGTGGLGLLRLRQRRVTMLQPARRRPNASGGPMLEDERGDLWFGTREGLSRLAGGTLTTYFTPTPGAHPGNWPIESLYQDRAGALWMGTLGTLVRYQQGRFTQYPLPGVSRQVGAILEDRQGQLWLGTLEGLVRFAEGRMTRYDQRDGLVNNNVRFLLEDRAGALWIGTDVGLSRFENGVFTSYTTAQGLANNYVRAIHEDADGTLWLGTYGGGLNRLRNGHITPITTKQGLFDDFISRILVGDNDTFWLLGNRGIFHVSRHALNEVADGQRPAVTCVVYDKADGMEPSEGQGGFQPAGWRARDGRFYFPTIYGVAVIDPSLASPLPPPVIIERVLLDGAELDVRQSIEIPSGKVNLEIHYTGLSLGKPEQVQFSFQLSGLKEEWVDVGRRRTAYFSQLQPGYYRFSVKALSPDGVWSAEAASLRLVVKPHFWETLWFRSFALAAMAGLLVLGYRQRVAVHRQRGARQEEFARELLNAQERERQRIVADLHDGLGQSLVVIKRRALQSLAKAEDAELVLEQMQEIADATTTALDEVRDVIFNLRPPQLERLGLTGAIAALLDHTAESNGWQVKKQLDEIDGIFAPEAENSLYRIVQECLTNISKHAAATEVSVRLMRRTEAVELTVHDNGRGVALDKTAGTGFGWRGLRERARLLSGKLTITSTPGQGTTVRLVLLLPILTAEKD